MVLILDFFNRLLLASFRNFGTRNRNDVDSTIFIS